MSVFLFGYGKGRMNKTTRRRMDAIARKHGCGFAIVTGNSGHCTCGNGCRINACLNVSWWFEGPNRGEPFDRQLAAAVAADVEAMTVKS